MLLQSRRTQCGNFGGIYDRSFFKFLPTKEGADEVFQDIMADSAEKLSFAVDEVSTESPVRPHFLCHDVLRFRCYQYLYRFQEFPAQNLVGNGDNGWCCEKLGVSEAVVIVKVRIFFLESGFRSVYHLKYACFCSFLIRPGSVSSRL